MVCIVSELEKEKKIEEKIAEAIYKRLGRIRISIDYSVFLQTLLELGLTIPVTSFRYAWLKPGASVEFVETVPEGYIGILGETRWTCSPDHDIEFYTYVDDQPAFYDQDCVGSRYLFPLSYAMLGTLLPVKKSGRVVVINKSSTDTAYFSYQTVWALVSIGIWDITMRAVSRIIGEEFKLPEETWRRPLI